MSIQVVCPAGGQEPVLGCQVLGELLVKPQPRAGMGTWDGVGLHPEALAAPAALHPARFSCGLS